MEVSVSEMQQCSIRFEVAHWFAVEQFVERAVGCLLRRRGL